MPLNRAITPPTILPTHLELPPCELLTTTNGVKLYAMDAGQSAVVRLSIVFHCGSRHQTHPFTASATLNMLSEGTRNLSSSQIAEQLDFYGIFYDTSIDRDFSIVTVNCLSKFLPETLALLEECLLHPTFPASELEIYKTKRREQLRIEREKPSYLAREQFSRSLFGASHPYGYTASDEEYQSLTNAHLTDFYSRYFVAENCFAVASGKLPVAVVSQIATLLTKIPHSTTALPMVEIPVPISEPTAHIHRDDALQTSIRIGKLLFTKGHPDFNGMQVVATILGGYFGSRLVANLREERGYTYGIYAAMVALEKTGYIAIATDVTAESTEDSLIQIFAEIKRLQTELVPANELEIVKNMIAGEMMRILDGPFGVADVVIENIQSQMDPAYLNTFLQEVRNITPERIQALAVQYLNTESFTTVTVGSK